MAIERIPAILLDIQLCCTGLTQGEIAQYVQNRQNGYNVQFIIVLFSVPDLNRL